MEATCRCLTHREPLPVQRLSIAKEPNRAAVATQRGRPGAQSARIALMTNIGSVPSVLRVRDPVVIDGRSLVGSVGATRSRPYPDIDEIGLAVSSHVHSPFSWPDIGSQAPNSFNPLHIEPSASAVRRAAVEPATVDESFVDDVRWVEQGLHPLKSSVDPAHG